MNLSFCVSKLKLLLFIVILYDIFNSINDLPITDPGMPTSLYNSNSPFTTQCLTEWDSDGSYYRGSINYDNTSVPCDYWEDHFPHIPHSLINEGNYCRGYGHPKTPKCFVNGKVQSCYIPQCQCYSPYICIGPSDLDLKQFTQIEAEKKCNRLGATGTLKIRSFVHNDFVRKYIANKPGIYWLGYELSPVIGWNKSFNFEHLQPIWGEFYGYRNFDPQKASEFINVVDGNIKKLCVILDNQIPSDYLFWKLEYCFKLHSVICDFSQEGYDVFRDNEKVFTKCAPPPLSLWNNQYVGNVSRTKSGFPCQKWKVNYPNYISQKMKSLASAQEDPLNHNHCRSIGIGYPVCMRDYPGGDFELCDIPVCVNVAYFGQTYQSTTQGNQISSLAVDGRYKNGKHTCSETQNDHNQWWEIELTDRFFIAAIVIVSKFTSETNYNHINIEIRNKNVPHIFSEFCVENVLWISTDDPRIFNCNKWGQIIRIFVIDPMPMPLILCEVEIYTLSSTEECYNYESIKMDYQGSLQYSKAYSKRCSPWKDFIKSYYEHKQIVFFPEGMLNKEQFQWSVSGIYHTYLDTLSNILQNHCRFIRFSAKIFSPRSPVCPDNNLNLIPCESPPKCSDKNKLNTCMFNSIGEKYRGNVNITQTGKFCIPWSKFQQVISTYPYLENDLNYCRNPNSDVSGPWCFVDVYLLNKEFCNVPQCVNMAQANFEFELSNIETKDIKILWDNDKSDMFSHDYVTLKPILSEPAFVLFKFKYPILLIAVAISPYYKERSSRARNFGNFFKLKIQTGHDMKDLKFNTSTCNELHNEVYKKTFFMDCPTLTSIVKISAASLTDELDIAEISLFSEYSASGCINSNDISVLGKNYLCSDIRNLNIWQISDSSKVRCTLWKMYHPHVLEDVNKYCNIITLQRQRYNYSWPPQQCGFDVCKNRLNYICKISKFGIEYRGNHSVTRSGYPCDKWSNYKSRIKDNLWLIYEENYCRNPTKDPKGPWCFIKHLNKNISHCKVPECINIAPFGVVSMSSIKSAKNIFCLEEKTGKDYIGFLNYSINGYCKRWSEQNFNKNENDDHNYCRNYGNRERPWCFVYNLQFDWAYCDIPLCSNFSQGNIFGPSRSIDYILQRNLESCAVSKEHTENDTPYITWKWLIGDVARIVGIRIYPQEQYLEDNKGLNILLYNSGFRETVICKMQNLPSSMPFTDYPCIYKANKLMAALKTGQNKFKNSTTLAICQIEIYITGETRDCFNFLKGIDFMGLRSVTISGKLCTKWKMHKISQSFQFPEGPGSDPDVLNIVHNYCRNPVLNKTVTGTVPYCFTGDNEATEPCDISLCTDDEFSVSIKQPSNARLNKSFALLCVANLVGYYPIVMVWMTGVNEPIQENQIFQITQINSTTTELNIHSVTQAMTTIICQATFGSHFASATFSYSVLPECQSCWNEIKKLCSIICGLYDPPINQPLYKNCKMTCVLETVNATVQCTESKGLLSWKPVDICTYVPMITDNMAVKEHAIIIPSNTESLKEKYLELPDYLIIYFFLIFLFIFSVIMCSMYSESLRALLR